MTGFRRMDLQGKKPKTDIIEQTHDDLCCRMSEESIRFQDIVSAINRGTLPTEGFKDTQLPFATKLAPDEVLAPNDTGAGKRGNLMPFAVRFSWNSLAMARQQQYITQVLSHWARMEKTMVGRAIVRVWREDATREREATIQFAEPENVAQLKHIGKIKLSVLQEDERITKVDNAPAKVKLILSSDSGVSAKKPLYGINICIRDFPTAVRGSQSLMVSIGELSPALLGGQLTDWTAVPRTSKMDADNNISHWYYCRVHGLAAEYILTSAQTSLNMSKPYEALIMFEAMPRASLPACYHCGSFGRHEATLEGKATCDTSGHCQYCGIETQKTTYLLHEKECPDKDISRKCFRCKGSLKSAKHSPIDISLCNAAFEAKMKAERRRRDLQLFFNCKLELGFIKKAEEHQEDGAKLLRLRSRIGQTRADLEKYVSSTRKLTESVHPEMKPAVDD